MSPARNRQQTVSQLLGRLCRASAELLVPSCCCLCGRHDVPENRRICAPCVDRISADPNRLCPHCASHVNAYSISGGYCAHCRFRRYRFDRAVSLGPYQGDLRDTIVRMKQSAEQSLTYSMGQLVGDRAITIMGSDIPNVLVPVPMNWRRRIFRTTSSADYLAAGIADVLGGVVERRLLVSERLTQKQSLLSDQERAQNVAKAFRCRANLLSESVHIGIVDDIITTGATMNELSRTLKRAGASRVTALVVARSTRSGLIVRKPR